MHRCVITTWYLVYHKIDRACTPFQTMRISLYFRKVPIVFPPYSGCTAAEWLTIPVVIPHPKRFAAPIRFHIVTGAVKAGNMGKEGQLCDAASMAESRMLVIKRNRIMKKASDSRSSPSTRSSSVSTLSEAKNYGCKAFILLQWPPFPAIHLLADEPLLRRLWPDNLF